jgi:hypothetical protein
MGITKEEAYTFWKEEFTKKMSRDKFEIDYSYYIRYNFGMKDKKQD